MGGNAVTLEFLGWDRPVVACVVERLLAGYSGGELNLSDTLFIVPTAEAGRRLREALAKATAATGGGVVAPHVWAPERVLMAPEDKEHAASKLQSWLAWAKVLSGLRPQDAESLFGVLEGERSWRWCLSTAELMMELSSTLGAGGWSFQAVAGSDKASQDSARWRELAQLEQRYMALLQREGFSDVQALKRQRAASPWLPEGVKRVLVVGAPDLPPLASRWLNNAAEQVEVQVSVLAPPSMRAGFDLTSRPLPVFWADAAALGAAAELGHISVASNPATQAGAVVDAVSELALQGRTAVGVCDAEVSSAVHERMTGEGVHVFEPGGVSPQAAGLWFVLQSFQEVLEREAWGAFASLLRIQEVRDALTDGIPNKGLLEAADDFAAEHMPLTLSHARDLMDADTHPALVAAVEWLTEWREAALEMGAEGLVRDLLLRIYGQRQFVPNEPVDRLHGELAEAALETAAEVDAEMERFAAGRATEDKLSLVMDLLQTHKLTEPRGDVDLVLQGWLELLWEEAPCLVVAGVNEESVPGILISHPFLPDALRERLDLPSQASRYARDAYLMHALSSQRANGAIRWICGQWSDRGDALKPSRLLMRCADDELPERVLHLFPREEDKKTVVEPPRSLTWKLKPPAPTLRKLETISPSRLASYLTCPFGYFLDNELRWGDAVEPEKREMDAMEFGNLIHHAMEQMAKNDSMRVCESAKDLGNYLESEVQHRAKVLWGSPLPMLVRLQVEGACQRVRAVAETEVASRQDGWQIVGAEISLGDEGSLLIGGAKLRGKIDRVERRDHGGKSELRILDFKTSDKVNEPMKAHLRKLSGRSKVSEEDEWMRVQDRDGKTWHQWTNLQLPLYAAAMKARGMGVPDVGYFCVPKAVQDVRVMMWKDFDEWWVNDAIRVAEAIVQRIEAGAFWPPKDEVRDGDLPFLGDVLGTVAWGGTANE